MTKDPNKVPTVKLTAAESKALAAVIGADEANQAKVKYSSWWLECRGVLEKYWPDLPTGPFGATPYELYLETAKRLLTSRASQSLTEDQDDEVAEIMDLLWRAMSAEDRRRVNETLTPLEQT